MGACWDEAVLAQYPTNSTTSGIVSEDQRMALAPRLTEDSYQERDEELCLGPDDLVQMHQCERKPAQSCYYCAGRRWCIVVVLEHGGGEAIRTGLLDSECDLLAEGKRR